MSVATTQQRDASDGSLAAEALRLAEADPSRARALADLALAGDVGRPDPLTRCTAEQALARVAHINHDPATAVHHSRRAVRIATAAGDTRAAAEARVGLAAGLAMQGFFPAALRQVDAAAAVLRGADAVVLDAQRAWLLQMQGRLHEALAAYRAVLPAFVRDGDRLREAKARNNLGLILDRLGDSRAANAELVQAEGLYVALGQDRVTADVRLNLGWVAVHRGELPAALRWFDIADEYFRGQGKVDPIALRDRCEGLLAARLVPEARRAAEQAVRELERLGMALLLAETRLHLSEAALLGGDVATAEREATAARVAFQRQRRPGYVALARFAELRAAWLAGARSARTLASARQTARALAGAGWTVPALEANLMAGALAVASGRLAVAREELDHARSARRHGPAEIRSRAWHAEALLRLAGGDRRGAEAALRAGIRQVDAHRATLGATELRVHASVHATDLVELGMRLALEDRSAQRLFHWAERWRACTLRLRPVRPPDDPDLAADIAQLRGAAREATERTLAGQDTSRERARQARLEESVRRRIRHLPGPGNALHRSDPPPSLGAVTGVLGDQALVELASVDGFLHAVVVASGRARLRPLGPIDDVRCQLDGLRFGLRRLLWTTGSLEARAARREAVRSSARRLDDLLVRPLIDDVGDRSLVIVPTGLLHTIPWASLPSCRGRAVSVAPSAALWFQASSTPAVRSPRRVVLAAGPDLPGAAAEVADLQARYPRAARLSGQDASVEQVLLALDGADLAHVAAHAVYRADNPLFSSILLHDGPLTVCDLERLDQAPKVIVASACESGVSSVGAGDELMGLAAALFALGTRSLVATVLPLPDGAARPLMLAMHQHLRAGRGPADALARAQAAAGTDDEAGAAASAFVAFGAA